MIGLDLGNVYVDYDKISPLLATIKHREQPEFVEYSENIARIRKDVAAYKRYSKLLILGHGGSINSFKALFGALSNKVAKSVGIVNTNDPDAVFVMKKKFSRKNTLVMGISKSGDNVSMLEALFAFKDYKILVVTGTQDNPLRSMAKKNKWKVVNHPEIGGRYSGISSCTYTPLLFLGIDVKRIAEGAKRAYDQCRPNVEIGENPALQLATALFLLELQGYSEVMVPIYSVRLAGFLPLIIQLMHEGVCKSGRGQTFYGDMGPEIQHHTMQRFFGGKKNVIGLFVRVKELGNEDEKIVVPKPLQSIRLKDATLAVLDGVPYSRALDFEFLGVREHTIHYKIPYSVITVNKVDEESAGEFMAFWHYVAIYSAWLRNVNPFDQPEVEFSKKHSFELRKNYRR